MLIISWRTGWAGTHGSRRAWAIRCRGTTPTWAGPAGGGHVRWGGATGTGGPGVRRRHDGRPEADRGDADGGGRADTGQPGPAESDPEHLRTPFTVLL